MIKKLSLFLLLILFSNSAFADSRKNILFLMTDDQAPWAVGVYEGQTHADTPNLDALFKSGAYLPNTFVTTPVCSPSRVALACSQYGSELGITDWIHPNREPDLGLDPKTLTWYEALQQAGYHTGLVGKWHIGLLDKHHPTKTGFDYFMGHRGGGWSPKDPRLEKDGKQQKFKGLTTDILGEHAVGFLEKQEKEKPFLLVVHFRAPHARWLPVAPEDWEPFDQLDPKLPHPDYPGLDIEKTKRYIREYLASVRGVDRNVGKILSTLKSQGLDENTVVVFTSDHGYNMGHNGIWHKGNGHWILNKEAMPPATDNIPSGQRPNMYDASLKVPTAVRWPGVTTAGTTITQSVTQLDWFPTMLGIAGVKPPEGKIVRGRDLSELLAGKVCKNWENGVFTQYSTKHQSTTHMRSYRTPKWKLIRDFLNPERDELFDLVNDPEETTNVIGGKSNTSIISKLDAQIREHMKTINDPVLKN